MPWDGYDSPQHGDPIDMSGGGIDPSYAYSLAAGSPFPGSDWSYLAYNSGNPYGSPGWSPPGWLSSAAGHVRGGTSLLNAHARNVNSPGAGQDPGLGTAGYPYQFFSGPGAPYGAAGDSATRGLVDIGRGVGEIWDHPEWQPEGTSTSGDPGKKKGHGGQSAGHFSFQPYQGLNYHSSFVDWQPTAPGTAPQGATRFVPGAGSSLPGGPPPAAPGGSKKPGKGGGLAAGSGQGRGGGAGGPGSGPGGPGTGKPGQGKPGGQGGPGSSFPGPGAPDQGQAASGRPRFGFTGHGTDSMFGGVDVNNLDFRTPGWLADPTTGILNTAGMPNATPFAPNSDNRGGYNQAFDAYLNQLHDQGLSTNDIMSLLGPYGYKIDDSGDFQWQWGSGPVVRGDNGYAFARQASGGGGGGGGDEKPTAADNISTGWTPTARYF